jgi:hypothetical protein
MQRRRRQGFVLAKGTGQSSIKAQAGRAGPRWGNPTQRWTVWSKTPFCVGCGTVASLEWKVGCFGGSRLRDRSPMWDALFAAGKHDRSDEERNGQGTLCRTELEPDTRPTPLRPSRLPHHQRRDPGTRNTHCKPNERHDHGTCLSWQILLGLELDGLRAGASLCLSLIPKQTRLVRQVSPSDPRIAPSIFPSRAAGNSGFLQQTGVQALVILHFDPWFRSFAVSFNCALAAQRPKSSALPNPVTPLFFFFNSRHSFLPPHLFHVVTSNLTSLLHFLPNHLPIHSSPLLSLAPRIETPPPASSPVRRVISSSIPGLRTVQTPPLTHLARIAPIGS